MNKKMSLKRVLMLFITVCLCGCSSEQTYMAHTNFASDYSDGYVYFYRNNDEEGGITLNRYNVKTDTEEELQQTQMLTTVREYNNRIYYFDTDFDICAMDKQSLKSRKIYSADFQLGAFNDYFIDTGSKFLYCYGGKLNIQDGNDVLQLEDEVIDFTIYKNQIYYVEVPQGNDEDKWSIKKILNYKTLETEEILSLYDVIQVMDIDCRFGHGVKLDNISIYNDILYFTAGEHTLPRITYLCAYDLNSGEITKITDEHIRDYQVLGNFAYYTVRSDTKELKRYNLVDKMTETLFENVYSFRLTEDNVLLYKLINDDTLYVKGDNINVSIPNTLF